LTPSSPVYRAEYEKNVKNAGVQLWIALAVGAGVCALGLFLLKGHLSEPSTRIDLGIALVTLSVISFGIYVLQARDAEQAQSAEERRAQDSLILQLELQTNLANIHLAGKDLAGIVLNDKDLHGAVLDGANLEGAYLDGVNLHFATLHSVDLEAAYLESANLRYASFDPSFGGPPSDLTDAHLGGADLTDAVLKDAILDGADLEGSHLEGTDLTGVSLTGARLGGAQVDSLTTMPRGGHPKCKHTHCPFPGS
jgi:hypothetical protein